MICFSLPLRPLSRVSLSPPGPPRSPSSGYSEKARAAPPMKTLVSDLSFSSFTCLADICYPYLICEGASVHLWFLQPAAVLFSSSPPPSPSARGLKGSPSFSLPSFSNSPSLHHNQRQVIKRLHFSSTRSGNWLVSPPPP